MHTRIERLRDFCFSRAYDIAGRWDNLGVIVTVKTKTTATTKNCCLHITNWASVQWSSGEKAKRLVAELLLGSFIRRLFAATRKRWLHSEINWAINLLAVITYLFGVFYKYTTKDTLARQFERIGFCCRAFFSAWKTAFWMVIGGKTLHSDGRSSWKKNRIFNTKCGQRANLNTQNAHSKPF